MDTNLQNLPRHIGVIPDGNRRWSKDNGRSSLVGHRQGLDVAKRMALKCFDMGIEAFTLYAFSTENWKRAQDEVGYLMDLFFSLVTTELHELEERNVRFRFIGIREGLSTKLLRALDAAESRTANNHAGTMTICLNYSGQQELADAATRLIGNGQNSPFTIEDLNNNLYAPELPDLDLVLRTSGEQRLSGFMLMRAAYAELIFVDKHWPAFDELDLNEVLTEFSNRQRRFGS